jgi:hypothetical protein
MKLDSMKQTPGTDNPQPNAQNVRLYPSLQTFYMMILRI